MFVSAQILFSEWQRRRASRPDALSGAFVNQAVVLSCVVFWVLEGVVFCALVVPLMVFQW